MNAMDVAQVLNAWWPIKAGPAPDSGSSHRDARRAIWASRVPWPRVTASVLRDRHDIPIIWAAPGADIKAYDDSPRADLQLQTWEPAVAAGLRQLADRPVTTSRWNLLLPDPAPTLASGLQPTPAAASACCQYVMTLRHVAINLQDRAALPQVVPTRNLTGEATVYLQTADQAEELLPTLVEPWWDQALADIAAAGKTPLPPRRSMPATVPASFR